MHPQTFDRAILILEKTNDGDALAPFHLHLVQEAINQNLNEKGEAAFLALYEQCISEQGYAKPWLHEIEHLTIDHEGYVFWKGKEVEHYSFKNKQEEKAAAEELARRCRLLEERGQEVNTTTAVWRWKE